MTAVYVVVSHRLFRLTIALRARLIPDGTASALRYLAGGENWLPHPGNAENSELLGELEDRFVAD